jgi:hypothetical protein
MLPNKALQPTSKPLRGFAAAELWRYAALDATWHASRNGRYRPRPTSPGAEAHRGYGTLSSFLR